MGKLAVADEHLWQYCKQFNPPKGYVAGLIVGQPSKATDYVVRLGRIPIPLSVLKEHGKKPSEVYGLSLAEINESWVSVHAVDVTKMLHGGMWVLGLFLIGQSDPFENQQNCSRLRTILRHMRTELKKIPLLYGDSPSSEKIVLYMNPQKNLVACRSIDLDGSSMRPMDWKFQKNAVSWTQIDSILDVQHVVHLKKEDSSKQIRNELKMLLDGISKQVQESVCTLSNQLLGPDELVENIFKKQKGKSGKKTKGGGDDEPNKNVIANLYMPLTGESSVKSPSGVEVNNGYGIFYFVGGPVSRVFVNQKATVEEACQAVKQDIIRSIYVRLNMHSDSLVEDDDSGSRETFHEPPRRVMIKLPATNVSVSDYLYPGEGPEDALNSFQELFDLKLEIDDVELDVEMPAGKIILNPC
ncbi:hypothetical protein ONE63_002012 [Megalurothrips usitatus]|uniref:Protein odr-4 homolog n=1 Tax=Megalurothrips usitatus TaxID=439358 RepID=A0AAV7XCE7_9NEOP|nr:hypothetical protein ONE63_002012 [Megalurothrips usitatus]